MKKTTNPNPSQPAPAEPSTSPFSPEPNEPPNAFEAFLLYFQLSGKRHLTTIARQTGASLSTIKRWANTFDWSGRLNRRALSLLQGQETRDERQRQETLDWAERSGSLREREWEIADDLLDALQRRIKSDVLDQATLADIARSLALASKIGRLATGLAATPPVDTSAEDPRVKELNDALDLLVHNFEAKQAAAAAAATSNPQPPATPNL